MDALDAKTVTDCLFEPVFAVDINEDIMFVNARLSDITQVSQDTAAGSDIHWLEQFVADGFDKLYYTIASVSRGETEDQRVNVEMQHPLSAPVPRQLTAQARVTQLTRDGDRLGALVVLRDMTIQRQQRERLRVLSRILRHDIRNQLNMMRGLDTVAADLEDDQKQRVEAAVEAVDRLCSVADKARFIERKVAGENQSSPRNLVRIVSGAAADIRGEYPDAAIEDPTAEFVYGDVTDPFATAVAEVARNAIEHNDSPEPHVDTTVAETLNGEYVDVRIADNGPGIEPKQAEIAEGKRQADQSTMHLDGLGLWTARWVMQNSGGRLKFASNAPRGTIVTLRVPCSEGPDRPT